MDFYQTPIYPCGYLPNRYSVNIFADPNKEISTQTYSWLIDYGFRRNGSHLYRPQCPECNACIPTRVCIDEFKPRRSQKRSLMHNQDLEVCIVKKEFKQEHFDLYKQYIQCRHEDGPMSSSTKQDYQEFIIGTWSETFFMEFRIDKKLICVAVFDVLPQGLSAAYTYYDTAYQNRGLGTFAILKLIEETKNQKLPYLYLGYWIEECQKMSYKVNFKPVEGYLNKTWQLLPEEIPRKEKS
ncbi:MAG: arginyltransferase [Gammaproteobacteria bacterium]|nr:arginyltransferase [Gammaproteobacteria bacterium]